MGVKRLGVVRLRIQAITCNGSGLMEGVWSRVSLQMGGVLTIPGIYEDDKRITRSLPRIVGLAFSLFREILANFPIPTKLLSTGFLGGATC